MTAEDGCVFCGIVAGDVPAEVVKIGRRVVAFKDINAQAPLHALVIPRQHHRDVQALAAADPEALAELVEVAAGLAAGVGEDGAFRLVFNTGTQAGQSVFHAHGHVVAGRRFGWPPG
jgi:histidine triad (HIT) family protein